MSVTNIKIGILGTPRSGTLFMSHALKSVGLRVGHEEMERNGTVCGFWVWTRAKNPKTTWLPCKHRDRVEPVNFHVTFHLHRHPLSVMRSLPRVFERPAVMGIGSWMRGTFGKVDRTPKHNALLYWVRTQQLLIEQNLPRISTETFATDWPRIMDAIGMRAPFPTIGIPNESPGYMVRPQSWDDLKAIDESLAAQAQMLARELGYKV